MEEPQGVVGDESQIDLLLLIGVLFKHRIFILVFTALASVGVVVFAVLSLVLPPEKSPLPNQYRSHALILINEEDKSDLSSVFASSGLGSLAGVAGIRESKSYGELAVKLLSNRALLDNIADEFDIVKRYRITKSLRAESRRIILKKSDFNYDSKTSTVGISYEDHDAVFSSRVVNRMVDLLDQRFAAIGGNRILTRKDLLEKKLADVLSEMSVRENQLQDFQREYGVLTVEALATEQVTVLARLRSQLILKEMEIKTYSDFSKVDDPILRRMKSERDNLVRLLRELEEGVSSYEKVMPSQKQLPEIALEFARLKRDLLVQQKVYEMLTQQYELVKLEVEAAQPIFQVLELAEPSDEKSGPSRSVICAVTSIASFFLSIIIVFIMNAIKNIRDDPEKLKRIRGVAH